MKWKRSIPSCIRIASWGQRLHFMKLHVIAENLKSNANGWSFAKLIIQTISMDNGSSADFPGKLIILRRRLGSFPGERHKCENIGHILEFESSPCRVVGLGIPCNWTLRSHSD